MPDIDYGRLVQAMQRSRKALEYPRRRRAEAVREYAGAHWSDEGARRVVPLNVLSLYVSIVGRSLVAKAPRVLLTTFDRARKAAVAAMQDWCNKEVVNSDLAGTLQRVVLDALFGPVGCCKVALASPADSAAASWSLPAGRPFADPVDLDDLVWDAHAKRLSEAAFVGHRVRRPLDVVRDSKLYSGARKKLEPTTDRSYNAEGDERVSMLGRTYYGASDDEFEDMVDLWEVYLPRHRKVVTLADDCVTGGATSDVEPLREADWLGPDRGPYHFLGYGVVPGNAMYKGPVQDLTDLHDALNRCYRKLIRQAGRQKEQLLVTDQEDGDRIVSKDDGDAVKVRSPDSAKVANYGGANPNLQQFALHLKDLFSWAAGNLDMMGGLSPQSKTLGQDRMLQENASQQVASLQEDTVNFAGGVLGALCWYWWHDPYNVMRSDYPVPGLKGVAVGRQVYPGHATDRQGRPMALRREESFEDLGVRVDPYSLRHQSPEARAQVLTEVVGMLAPFYGGMQAQGITMDFAALLKKLAEYRDIPDLGDILTVGEPPPGGAGSIGGGATMAPQTKRTYERVSRPSKTPAGQSAVMQQILAGGNPQSAERNGVR